MKNFFDKIIIVLLLLNVLEPVTAQADLKLYTGNSKMIIKGTSNLHDWEENVDNFNVQIILDRTGKEITSIKKVTFSCPSTSIISENSIMTSKTHDALKVDKHPDIVFTMVSVDDLKSTDGKFTGILIGDLRLAGVIKRIQIPFNGTVENNKLTVNGAKSIKLNDFNIKPPTAVLGTLKTGEIVTVSFSLEFRES